MRVDEYAATWLTVHPRPEETTNRQCAYGVRPFVRSFGSRRLDTITFAEAHAWGLKNRSAVRYARAMYEDARREGVVDGNPFSGLRLPGYKGRRDLKVLTEEELERLYAGARDAGSPAFARAIRFSAYTGVRAGELLALDVGNRHGDEFHVVGSLRPDGAIGPPKGGRARTILIPGEAWVPGMMYLGVGRLFPYTRRQHRLLWERTREAAGLEHVAWHELRHHAATWLLERCRDYELVAQQLGHASSDLVRKLYAHPDEAKERDRLREALA